MLDYLLLIFLAVAKVLCVSSSKKKIHMLYMKALETTVLEIFVLQIGLLYFLQKNDGKTEALRTSRMLWLHPTTLS